VTAWRPDLLKPCGTTAAYRRHLRNDEPACPACLQANSRAWANYRAIHGHPRTRKKP